jgi:hypothetical protein
VACHGCCSDREGRGGEEDQEEEAEGARRSVGGGGESRRGNAHALAEVCFSGLLWILLRGGFCSACVTGGERGEGLRVGGLR